MIMENRSSDGNRCSFIVILIVVIIFIGNNAKAEYDRLEKVHVIFRHGERTLSEAASSEGYPKDPYLNETFFPVGRGRLTNAGKMSMYEFGVILRKRYDNFLGDFYYPGVTRVRTTTDERAIISAQLVNAGLWPPKKMQQWNEDLPWIPIPYECPKSDIDILMWSYKCPAYKTEYHKIMESEEVQKLIEPHREFFSYLSEHTGENITTPKQVFFLYHTLESEMNYNLTLPSWTNGYFPDGEIYDVTLLEYDISNWGDFIKKIYGGPLIRDILMDYKKLIDDTERSRGSADPKITLYSGHESNICSVLKTLGLWKPHVPDFSSALMFELYSDNSTNEFAVQIFYYLGTSGRIIPQTLSGCTQICPLNEFRKLLSNVIPDDVEKLCGAIKNEALRSRSSSLSLETILYIALQSWILLLK